MMQGSVRSRAFWARLIVFGVVLALAFGALPAAAAPFAYVANAQSVSVIDTATNKKVGTPIPIPVGLAPLAVAVAPDGTRVYVTHTAGAAGNTVSVIDTATDIVVATVGVGSFPLGVAVAPDGTRV
jgi:YVTN family beta-propeller protein